MASESVIYAPISLGELWDKYTILMIKKSKVRDLDKLNHVNKEIEHLDPLCKKYQIETFFYNELLAINTELWNIEDNIREKEKDLLFDQEFISIARSVYKKNDVRAAIKRKINTTYNSELVEVKDY